MVGALSGGTGLGSASSVEPAQQIQKFNGSSLLNRLNREPGTTVTLSGAGQLLSDLQQLQTQNPTKFKQVTSQIATQLQSAAQQAQGAHSHYLSSLSSQFQSIANGGSLSQLMPQPPQNHHYHTHRAYSANSSAQNQGLAGLAQASASQASANSGMQHLFKTISSEVRSALKAN